MSEVIIICVALIGAAAILFLSDENNNFPGSKL